MFDNYKTFDWFNVICFVIIGILLIGIIFYATMTKCTEYKDSCYKKVPLCTKGCVIVEKPSDCGDYNVVGHKKFCTKRSWRWEK